MGIQKYEIGFASAISVMVLVATLVMTAIVWRVTGFGQDS
jgi:ABC-type sugar transport system permease subunit